MFGSRCLFILYQTVPNYDQSDPRYECRLFLKSKDGEIAISDDKVLVTNNTALCETRTLSQGAFFSLVGINELQNLDQLFQTVEGLQSMKFTCNILYFRRMLSRTQFLMRITCVETSKVMNICEEFQRDNFTFLPDWKSPPLSVPPMKKMNVSVRGSIKKARQLRNRKLILNFCPAAEIGFVKLQLEIENNINNPYGIIELSDEKNEIIDDIWFDPSYLGANVRNNAQGSNNLRTPRNDRIKKSK